MSITETEAYPVPAIQREPANQESIREVLYSVLNDLKSWPKHVWVAVTLVILFYIPNFMESVPYQWANEMYSFGLLIVPLVIGLLILMRNELRGLPLEPDKLGVWVILFGVFVEEIGWYLHIRFLAMGSLVPVVAGCILLLAGRKVLKTIWFPVAFLIFASPFPEPLLNPIDLHAQTLSTIGAQWMGTFVGLPIVREGNVLQVPGMSLDVAEACSGFQKLTAFFCFAILYGWLYALPGRKWLLLILMSAPIAMIANVIRITALAILAANYGKGTEAVAHEYADYFVIILSGSLFIWLGRYIGCETTRF